MFLRDADVFSRVRPSVSLPSTLRITEALHERESLTQPVSEQDLRRNGALEIISLA